MDGPLHDFHKVQFQLRQFFATLCIANYFFDISGRRIPSDSEDREEKNNYLKKLFEFVKEKGKLKKGDIIWGYTVRGEFALVE